MIWTLPKKQVNTTSPNLKVAQTLAHNFVDLAVFLSTDKFLMLISKLNLDSNLALSLRNECEVGNDSKGRFYCVIRTGDSESHFVVRNIRVRIGANITEHDPNVIGVRKLPRIWLLNVPSGTVKLASLYREVSSGVSINRIHIQES